MVNMKGKMLTEITCKTFTGCNCSKLAAVFSSEHMPKVAELWDSLKLFFTNLHLCYCSSSFYRHLVHMNSGSGCKGKGHYFLCTHCKQPPQKIAMLHTPV